MAQLRVVLQPNPPILSCMEERRDAQEYSAYTCRAQTPKIKYAFRPTIAAASLSHPTFLDLPTLHGLQQVRRYGYHKATPQNLAVDLNEGDATRLSAAHLHPAGKQQQSIINSSGLQPIPPPKTREEERRRPMTYADQPRQHGARAERTDDGSRPTLVATEQQDVMGGSGP